MRLLLAVVYEEIGVISTEIYPVKYTSKGDAEQDFVNALDAAESKISSLQARHRDLYGLVWAARQAGESRALVSAQCKLIDIQKQISSFSTLTFGGATIQVPDIKQYAFLTLDEFFGDTEE